MKTTPRLLETIGEILQHVDLEVVHQHEDMVFVSQNLFILKITDDTAHIDLYFNEEIEETEAQNLMGPLEAVGELHGLLITYKGAYNIRENEDESLSVEFFDLLDG